MSAELKSAVEILVNKSQRLLLSVSLQKEIRSSLVLSMLQQMLAEDKADMVREAVVKSLGIIMGYIDDPDKYSQVLYAFQEVDICRYVNATGI